MFAEKTVNCSVLLNYDIIWKMPLDLTISDKQSNFAHAEEPPTCDWSHIDSWGYRIS